MGFQLTARSRLYIAFGVLFMTVVVCGGTGGYALQQVHSATTVLRDHWLPEVSAVARLTDGLGQVRRVEAGLVIAFIGAPVMIALVRSRKVEVL